VSVFLSGLWKIIVSISSSCIHRIPVYVPSRPYNFLAGLKLLNGSLYIVVRVMCTSLNDMCVIFIYLLMLKLCNMTFYMKSFVLCTKPQTGGLHLLM